jgi:hypothetical protein
MSLTSEELKYVRAAESRINDIAHSVKCELHPFVSTAILCELKTLFEVGLTHSININVTQKPFVSED